MGGSIEEFLKMAAARRQQGGQQQAQRRAQEPMVIEDVEIVDAQPATHSLASRPKVAPTVDTSRIAEKTSHLGEKIAQKHDRVEERIQSKFDHEVGHLNISDEASVNDDAYAQHGEVRSEFLQEMIQMLTHPRTVSQAILMNEILKRPEFD